MKKYQIPAEAQERAARRFQSLINSAREKAISSVPARRTRPLEETSAKKEERLEGKQAVEKSVTIKGKTYDKIDGEWYERTKKKSK